MVLGIYNVTLLNVAKKAFVRVDVTAKDNVRAYMKALKASKWANEDPDTILYHTDKISEFPDDGK